MRKLVDGVSWERLRLSGRQKSRWRQMTRFLEALSKPSARRYLDWISIFNEPARADLYREDFVATLPDVDPSMWLEREFRQIRGPDALTATSIVDLVTYLPCDLMTKVDIASMAHGLECRQPMLDHRVVELATSMPRSEKYHAGRGKRILRAAFGDLLPGEIWSRPKMGFGLPLDSWFRDELAPLTRNTLLSDDTQCVQWFRAEAIRRLIEQHQGQQADHSSRLWALLVLEFWLRQGT